MFKFKIKPPEEEQYFFKSGFFYGSKLENLKKEFCFCDNMVSYLLEDIILESFRGIFDKYYVILIIKMQNKPNFIDLYHRALKISNLTNNIFYKENEIIYATSSDTAINLIEFLYCDTIIFSHLTTEIYCFSKENRKFNDIEDINMYLNDKKHIFSMEFHTEHTYLNILLNDDNFNIDEIIDIIKKSCEKFDKELNINLR